MRVWETFQQAFCRTKHATGYPVAMLAPKLVTYNTYERTERNGT